MSAKYEITILFVLLPLIFQVPFSKSETTTTTSTTIPSTIATESNVQANPTNMPMNSTKENLTTPTTVTTTPISKPTTTTTTVPTTSPPPPEPSLDNFYCLCDHYINFCDMNCCCDQDCSDAEKALFTTCLNSPVRHRRRCFNSNNFFRNNTPYRMEQEESGLFCIVYDNYERKDELQVPKFLPGQIPKTKKPKFRWNQISKLSQPGESRAINPTPMSSGPGYIVGKPILMGVKLFRDLKMEINASNESQNYEEFHQIGNKEDGVVPKKKEIILLSSDETKWVTVPGPGDCNSTNRKSVLFAMNINSICNIDVSEYKSCQELQLEIGTVLLGILPVNFTNRFVSPFRNPNFEDIKNWIPVQISESPFGSTQNSFSLVDNGCDGLTTSMHIQIAYAYVGSVDFPQASILGVLYEFGESSNLLNKTERGKQSHIPITTTVGFIDITTKPTTKFAKWPTLSIELPSDFFYPFSLSSAPVLRRNDLLKITISLLIVVFLYDL